ncbi:MAG: succinate dehydrogenase / fumarate reductase membrane anchor subunit [Gammaproteobacteria bacterium]|jgi:succinate dehydrogenase / fumarate reductase membrane anchor subunit
MNLRSPLANVRGLGSAKEGTHHFWYQRVTAVVLVPLTIWIMTAIIMMTATDYDSVRTWIQSPFNALLLLFFIIALFFHAQLGVQVVIEDYIHSEWQKISCIILIKFLAILAGMASALAIIKIYLGL